MANKKYEETDIQAIAEAIRSKTGNTDTYKTSEMADKVSAVYDKGQADKWKSFMDDYIDSLSTYTVYTHGAFASQSWNDGNFYPTKDIPVCYGYQMFIFNGVTNLKQRLIDCGVRLDYTGCRSIGSMFEYARTSELPIIDASNCAANTTRVFYAASQLVSVDKFIVTKNASFGNTFYSTTKLEHIIFEGEIGTSLDIHWSPLTVESMKSIISCLYNYAGTTSENTYTVTFKASAFEALEAEGATAEYNGVACTWEELIDNLKWNLTLA